MSKSTSKTNSKAGTATTIPKKDYSKLKLSTLLVRNQILVVKFQDGLQQAIPFDRIAKHLNADPNKVIGTDDIVYLETLPAPFEVHWSLLRKLADPSFIYEPEGKKTNPNAVGMRIRGLLASQGRTIQDLTRDLIIRYPHMTYGHMVHFIGNSERFKIGELQLVAKALNVSVKDLVDD